MPASARVAIGPRAPWRSSWRASLAQLRSAAIVALECETDFVAKSAEFVQLVDELAAELAIRGPGSLEEQRERVEKLAATFKENVAIGRTVRFEAPPESVLGSYLHLQNGRGVNAVLVELGGGSQELAHDIAVHIAFARPEYVRREEVPADLVEAERKTAEATARNEGKPEAASSKIVEGRLNGWFKERCLLDQAYVRDEKRTISELSARRRSVASPRSSSGLTGRT